MKLKPIMFVGTGSDVGKSVINAAFCRIFLQDGYSPAPFKAQNMSLNSYATPNHLEIGRAQAMQAEASGINCSVEMNPILLKPTGDMNSQVVLNGKPIGNKSAKEYFLKTDRDMLLKEALKAYHKLAKKYNPMVIEGAGSVSEINLWDKDITNMKIAVATQASTFLVADIDKGGVFASVYGSIKLLPKKERRLIKGIIINKFRGDITLFEDGKKIIEDLIKIPVVGVIPYFRDIYTEPEDSVIIEHKTSTSQQGKINIGIVLLPHMSNFTDFDNLERIPQVHLYYSNKAEELEKADILIIPGTKNTIKDLLYLKENKVDKCIKNHVKNGKQVYGICGGYQIMGQKITDPYHVESSITEIEGLNILPIKTVLTKEKKTSQVGFTFLNKPNICNGYEIHMGKTFTKKPSPLCKTKTSEDGYLINEKVWGSYIHGIFDNSVVIENILQQIQPNINISFNYKAFKNEEFNKLASLVKANVNMEYIYSTLKI